jgi:hypothetical protein
MLDTANGLVRNILETRHRELVGEQRMHRLASEIRSSHDPSRPRRRSLATRVRLAFS